MGDKRARQQEAAHKARKAKSRAAHKRARWVFSGAKPHRIPITGSGLGMGMAVHAAALLTAQSSALAAMRKPHHD
jgi:hypothetical protein